LIYCNFEILDQFGNHLQTHKIQPPKQSELLLSLIKGRFLHGCALLIPKMAFDEVGLFDRRLRNTQDFEVWFKMIKAGYAFKFIPDVLVKSRHHNQQTSMTTSDRQIYEENYFYSATLKNFSAKELFGSDEHISLKYLDLASFFKFSGTNKAADTAYELSRKYLNSQDYMAWHLGNIFYSLAPKSFFNFLRACARIVRGLKRRYQKGFKKKVVKSELKTADHRKIKLLLIGNITSPHNQKRCHYLKKLGLEIYFLTTRKGKIDGVKTYEIVKNELEPVFMWFLRGIFVTKKVIKIVQPDIVQGQYLLPGGLWAAFSGFHPYIASVWGSDVFDFDSYNFLVKSLVRGTLKSADIILASSQALVDQAIKIGADQKKVEIVYFGVDSKIFKPKKIKHSGKIIYCPRAIESIYNTDVLIKAFAQIVVKYPDTKLALMDFVNDRSYFYKIKQYIKEHKLSRKIVFWPKVANADMAKYYNQADVVATIAAYDGSNISLLEAMACQKKIVVSEAPYLKKWQKGRNFWVVPAGNVEKTAQALEAALVCSDEKFESIGQLNRAMVIDREDSPTVHKRFEEIYQKILKG